MSEDCRRSSRRRAARGDHLHDQTPCSDPNRRALQIRPDFVRAESLRTTARRMNPVHGFVVAAFCGAQVPNSAPIKFSVRQAPRVATRRLRTAERHCAVRAVPRRSSSRARPPRDPCNRTCARGRGASGRARARWRAAALKRHVRARLLRGPALSNVPLDGSTSLTVSIEKKSNVNVCVIVSDFTGAASAA